jgi:hypothetical protein
VFVCFGVRADVGAQGTGFLLSQRPTIEAAIAAAVAEFRAPTSRILVRQVVDD